VLRQWHTSRGSGRHRLLGAPKAILSVMYRGLEPTIDLSDIPLDWPTFRKERRPFRSDGRSIRSYCFPLSDQFVRKLAGPQLEAHDVASSQEAEGDRSHIESQFDAISSGDRAKGSRSRGRRSAAPTTPQSQDAGFVVSRGFSGTGKTWLYGGGRCSPPPAQVPTRPRRSQLDNERALAPATSARSTTSTPRHGFSRFPACRRGIGSGLFPAELKLSPTT